MTVLAVDHAPACDPWARLNWEWRVEPAGLVWAVYAVCRERGCGGVLYGLTASSSEGMQAQLARDFNADAISPLTFWSAPLTLADG